MKDYNKLRKQKELIEKHIVFLKQQYLEALMNDVDLNREMQEASAALKKVTKQLNS